MVFSVLLVTRMTCCWLLEDSTIFLTSPLGNNLLGLVCMLLFSGRAVVCTMTMQPHLHGAMAGNSVLTV